MNELERMAEEKLQEKVSKKRIRRIKKKKSESCPLSPGVVSSSAEPSPVKGSSRKLSTKEPNMEKEDSDWIELCKFVKEYDFENNEVEPQDFEGEFERVPQSSLRKRIRRIKVSQTDPIGGRRNQRVRT